MPPENIVDCNGCTLCCCHELVIIMPGFDDPSLYETEIMHGTLVLKQDETGKCVHCDPEKGCMIWKDRPVMCKAFDCASAYRAMELDGLPFDADSPVMQKGKERAERNA